MEVTVLDTERLRNFISECTFTKSEEIKDETMLFDEGIFDSLGFLSLISYLEEEYGIEVENDELVEDNFQSINAIVAFLNSKKGIL